MKKNFRMLTLVVLLLSVGACGAPLQPTTIVALTDTMMSTATSLPPSATATLQPTATKGPPTVTPTLNPTVAMLEGTYTTTIAEKDLNDCENEGLFSLTLKGSSWSIDQKPAQGCTIHELTHFNGTFSIVGHRMVFDQVQTNCGGRYIYEWALEETSLVFTRVQDPCDPRVVIYEAHPWVKQ